MNIPKNLYYAKTHEWAEFTSDIAAKVGLTHFAQNAMGDIVFVNLPNEGDELTAGESLGDIESVKTVSDVVSPVSGTVSAVNEELLDEPGMINESPYDAWLVEVSNITDRSELMDAGEYEAFCRENG